MKEEAADLFTNNTYWKKINDLKDNDLVIPSQYYWCSRLLKA